MTIDQPFRRRKSKPENSDLHIYTHTNRIYSVQCNKLMQNEMF